MIVAYYKLVQLSDDLKASNKIKVGAEIPRYDCTTFAGKYEGIKPFISPKGMFKLSYVKCREFVKTDKRRMAEFALVGGRNLNFSSLFTEGEGTNLSSFFIEDSSEIYYGYPNGKSFLKNGRQNPLFPYRNDLYLFLIDVFFEKIEILVLPNQKGYALELVQSFAEGDFDDDFDNLKSNAKTFFNYGCL